MKDKIVIIGGGGHAKVLINIIKKNAEFEIVGYTDNQNSGEILGIAYLGKDNVLPEIFSSGVKYAGLGIGQIDLSNKRKLIQEKISKISFQFPAIISKDTIINEDVKIGSGTQIFDGVVINSGTRIGKFTIINTNSTIEHDCQIGDFTHIAPGATLSGTVKIGNGCMIGTAATVIQAINITDKVLIGAGSIVIKDVLNNGKYVGCPIK